MFLQPSSAYVGIAEVYLLSFCLICSKSSVLLGFSLTVPLMVACLSVAVPIWIRNGYQFWVSREEYANQAGNRQTPGMKEVAFTFPVALHLIFSHLLDLLSW